MDTEQIPVMENNEQMSAPEPTFTSVTPSPEVKKEKSSKGGPVIAILVFVVIALMCGLAYFILKDRGINLLSGVVKDTTTNTSTTDESNTTCTTNTNSETAIKDCTVALDNAGWNLFTVPKYNLSVEVPTYSTIPEIAGEKYQNIWKAWFDPAPVYLSDGKNLAAYWLENILGTMFVNFYPEQIPSTAGCDSHCLKEHYISVNIFSNTANQNLDNVIANYRSGWEKANVDEDVKPTNLKGNIITKWDMNVWDFEYSTPGGTTLGYLLIKNGNIYEVHYSLADSPAESYQIALKVIDSIKFE